MTLSRLKYLVSLVLVLIWVKPSVVTSQEKKPKVALVLSGGGVKGLAHIPTLQVLDSLGITPDLVIGNSMGSIVGALYAMGYSGDSIASIAKRADWDLLMGGGIALDDVSVAEKSEFGRYLIELDWADGKLNLGNFLINDQNLREFISSLTYPVYNINDFDDLAIPFRAVATDIINGKEMILDSGSLTLAIRASMSIPGAFMPVPYKETLLVDGGLLNNFPVDVAKNMGADFIIGSDVGGKSVDKQKLGNISSLLSQAGMLNSNLKRPENRKLTDILIDHSGKLQYSTLDFKSADAIYEKGKTAVQEKLDTLVVVSQWLKKYDQRLHKLPSAPDGFVLDTIVYEGIGENNLALVKARADLHTGKLYTVKDVVAGVNRAMGTTIFSQITYNPIINGDTIGLRLKGFERSRHQVKASVHYDGYNGVGLIANYTGRNIIGNASRTFLTLDIADQPKFRLQHQKHFGGNRECWWRSEIFGQRLKRKVFVGGEYVDNMHYRYIAFDNQVNRNLHALRSYIGLGIKYHATNLMPTIDPRLNNNIFKLGKYNNNDIELYAHYSYNSLNRVFYAKQGAMLKGFLGRSLHNQLEITPSDETVPVFDGSTNGFTRLGLDYEKRFPITDRLAAILGTSGHFIFGDALKGDDLSFTDLALNAKYFLGGNIANPRTDNIIFPGLKEGELGVTQLARLGLGLQINATEKIYINPHLDIASVGFGRFKDYAKDAFSGKGRWSEATDPSVLLSVGTTFSYDSILGPIDFDVSWVNTTEKLRFFIGIGYHFNPSD